ncbi:MAG TPA: hypothetical protein VKB49_18385 [Candidatus Sulfotelmatobacter sp.]|nr:hypothetical protein [Candidatus Sulfotelmatobacter sp.]
MGGRRWFWTLVGAISFSLVLMSANSAAQVAKPAGPRANAAPTQANPKDVSALQDQLLQLLRLSPTLAEVVARDPSLLANQEYVERNNPELAAFLRDHQEIAQNPDFYLFNNLHGEGEQPSETLERKLWPQMQAPRNSNVEAELINDGIPFLVFLCILSALLWLTHVLLENRRWNRIFKLQTDVHGKLIERFGTSQEVLTYMGTEAGKRFLEATPIAVGFERHEPVPSPVARVLTPLQIGVVMTLLGLGLILVRYSVPDAAAALLVLGTIVLTPGLGFIISAAITWALARRLGLMPNQETQN